VTFDWWYNGSDRKSMRTAILICCILALVFFALVGLLYVPGISFGVAVGDIDNGITIENVGNVACLVFLSLPEGVRQFQLAVGENVTVAGVAHPVDISATSDLTTTWADWERMKRSHGRLGIIYFIISTRLTDP
jgi:hypothetical protein